MITKINDDIVEVKRYKTCGVVFDTIQEAERHIFETIVGNMMYFNEESSISLRTLVSRLKDNRDELIKLLESI